MKYEIGDIIRIISCPEAIGYQNGWITQDIHLFIE